MQQWQHWHTNGAKTEHYMQSLLCFMHATSISCNKCWTVKQQSSRTKQWETIWGNKREMMQMYECISESPTVWHTEHPWSFTATWVDVGQNKTEAPETDQTRTEKRLNIQPKQIKNIKTELNDSNVNDKSETGHQWVMGVCWQDL